MNKLIRATTTYEMYKHWTGKLFMQWQYYSIAVGIWAIIEKLVN